MAAVGGGWKVTGAVALSRGWASTSGGGALSTCGGGGACNASSTAMGTSVDGASSVGAMRMLASEVSAGGSVGGALFSTELIRFRRRTAGGLWAVGAAGVESGVAVDACVTRRMFSSWSCVHACSSS